MASRWGVAATVKAPAAQVLAFAAHHLEIGAHRVWLHFDDPDDPAAALLDGHPKVQVRRCTDSYWRNLAGRRPEKHQVRQMHNINRITQRAPLPWIGHFDVDEFLVPGATDIAALLDAVPETQIMVRIEPWEALHETGLDDDIFTARAFRRQVPPDEAGLAMAEHLYGPAGVLLLRGMLSHRVGKCFFRTGVDGMEANIHAAKIGGIRLPGIPFEPRLGLLHFHAEDPARWRDRLSFRLARGAYRFNPSLQAHLSGLSTDGLDSFYFRVQTGSRELLDGLAKAGLLREEHLELRTKVARWFGAQAAAAAD